jgi:hypothetical protein
VLPPSPSGAPRGRVARPGRPPRAFAASRLEDFPHGRTGSGRPPDVRPLAERRARPAGAAAAPAGRHPGPASRHADRFAGVTRPYSTADVERLRASVRIEHTLARLGAERLWELLAARDYVHALGALTGGQAVQMVRAGLEAIYLSGWQVAADANLAGQTYPDQSLYPANSVPSVVRRINQALLRADEIDGAEGKRGERHWFAPIVATPRPASAARSTPSS